MQKIIKNTLLNYIPHKFEIENTVNPARIFILKNKPKKTGCILYLCEREIRAKDNFALQFAIENSKAFNLPLKIIHPQTNYKYPPKQNFIDRQVQQVQKIFDKLNIDFTTTNKNPSTIVKNINPATLIIDFNPILKRNYLKDLNCPVYEIDGHNIIPAKYVSQKQEYNAATLRRNIYHNIYPFLTEFNNETIKKVEADYVLDDFIKNKLPYYAELKNDPSKNIVSGLSKYLNLGFISSQRVALEIIKSNTAQENKESFLEELVIRKELSDNFCLYAENFKNFSGIPTWAKTSLNNHKFDLRTYTYSLKEFEEAKTHDKLWNAAQNQLLKEGSIHAYLRMYWAKKILEWTNSPSNALNTAIYLNDKYPYDSPSSNGYTGILWAIGGLHDRAFINYPITGKIRRMTYDSMKKKYNLTEYIKKYLPE